MKGGHGCGITSKRRHSFALQAFIEGRVHQNSRLGAVLVRRRIMRFTAMVFVPLIVGILQNDDLIRCQQRLDLFDGSIAVGLKAGPDLLQLMARGLDSSRVF